MKTTKEDRDWWRNNIPCTDGKMATYYQIPDLLDDIDTLKAALEQVEWVEEFYGPARCPFCWESEPTHSSNCPRQLALHEGE